MLNCKQKVLLKPDIDDAQDRLLAEIFEKKLPLIKAVVRNLMRRIGFFRPSDEEDLTQAAMVRIVELVRRGPFQSRLLDGWLRAVARNSTLEYLRSIAKV